MRRLVIALMLVSVAVFAVAGCGKSKKTSSAASPAPTTATPAKQVGAPGAKVRFVSPATGATTSSTVTAKVKLSGFTINAKSVGQTAKQGEGHLHFAIDGGKYDYPKYSGPNGVLGKSLGVNGKYSPSVTRTITYKGLPKGRHTLEVYLANNDHTNTGVEARTSFTVK